MKGEWYEQFKESGKLYLTDKSYELSKTAIEEDLEVYLRHITEGDTILEAACGPGYTAIPLSHHFKVTGFDKDERVLDAARKNAVKYGKDITFQNADFFKLVDVFGKDSFDAVSSGGVLEHFTKEDIIRLIDIQLEVAPIVFASMPLFSQEDVDNFTHGIEAFVYDREDWTEDILKEYNILEQRLLSERPVFGKFREFMIVVGRG